MPSAFRTFSLLTATELFELRKCECEAWEREDGYNVGRGINQELFEIQKPCG